MKPNFALSLSQTGIELLHRSGGGWQLVGKADPAASDLQQQLAVLRSTATGLEPAGLRCKLIIPNELIKYLTIDTGEVDLQERHEAARKALLGATPYAVDDLQYAICADGSDTHIAAVAKETLSEAESFAVDHRMHPVCFVATPDGDQFSTEPYFGETSVAENLLGTGERPEMDDQPVSPAPKLSPEPLQETIEDDWDPLEEMEAEIDDASVSFVSRRRVPTFKTSSPPAQLARGVAGATEGAVPGFGEEPAQFEDIAPSLSVSTPKRAPLHNPVRNPAETPESERMTVFGTRNDRQGADTKRRLALVAAVVILVPVGIAAFASGAISSAVSAIFDRTSSTPPAAQFAAPLQPELIIVPSATDDPAAQVELASLNPQLSDEDAAVLEALQSPDLSDIAPETPPTDQDMQASYAVTGIWPKAPDVPSPPALVDLDDLYLTSIDPINPDFDAIALPAVKSYERDTSLLEPASPAPAGTVFALNDKGMVLPSASGALNPDGIRVFSGPPPVRQPDNLLRIEEPGEDLAVRMALAGFRPKSRPDDLIEKTERATLSGLTRSELSQLRPRLRPQSAQENAAAAASLVQLEDNDSDSALIQPNDQNSFDDTTSRAVAASLRPGTRPNNFSEIVARAREASPPATPVATAAVVAPRAVTPSIPSSASVSREATVENAINLRRVNLIGVYGTPSSRRALVRLGNGRFRKVEVGDRIDGGQVSAIGDSELRYQKKGRAYVLKMPKG